jgi:hypothetical protein
LGVSFRIFKNIAEGGLQQKVDAAQVGVNLAAPGFPDQFIMVNDAAMGMQLAARL